METLLAPPTATCASTVPRRETHGARCPVRWTCPVCRETVAAGETHAHLALVIGAPLAENRLTALATHATVASLGIVRDPEGLDWWLVWSATPGRLAPGG